MVEFVKWFNPFTQVDEEDEDAFDDEEWAFHRKKFLGADLKPTPYRGYYMSSPSHGVFPLGDHNLLTRQMKLWVGHTNFVLTHADEGAIAAVPGVEGLRQITPYRFWLGVGHLFQQEQVKGAVRAALCPPPPPPPPPKDPLAAAAAKRFKAWAIVKRGNGRDLVGADDRQAVEKKVGDAEVLATSWGVASG
jgi:hypothetical protein